MTAALQLTVDLARKLRGNCTSLGRSVLARDGSKHDNCSTCHAVCGQPEDMGIADAGFSIVRMLDGLSLRWECPSCGATVNEQTDLFGASTHAKAIAGDALCHKCRP